MLLSQSPEADDISERRRLYLSEERLRTLPDKFGLIAGRHIGKKVTICHRRISSNQSRVGMTPIKP